MEPPTKKKKTPDYDAVIKITNPQSFRRVLSILKGIISKSHFHVEDYGLSLFSIDSSFVCAIDMKFECMIEYCKENVTFCINTECLHSFVAEIDSKAVLTLKIRDNKLTLLGSDNSMNQQRFNIPLIESEYQKPVLENIMSRIEVELNIKQLKSFINIVNKINGNDITIRVVRDGNKLAFVAFAEGEDGATAEITFQSHTEENDAGEFSINIEDKGSKQADVDDMNGGDADIFKASYSLSYLNSLIKPMDQQRISMSMCDEQPLRMTVLLGDNSSYLTALLSAKYDDDDEDE